MMDILTAEKSVFDMTPAELHEHLKPTAQIAKQTALDNGAWYSYRDESCVEDDMFIREFKDGHKELIQLGNQTGQYKILETL
jgi:hypothetical protein